MKFTELELRPEVLNALEEMGFVEMTPIQEEAIPPVMEGRDLVGLAETGSGKTSACAVPLVDGTDRELNAIQHLILVPTRELALQYVQEVGEVARYADVATFAVYGGFDMSIQKAKLNHGVHILVATPGRLIDFIWNTKLDLTQVRTVVLDEADEMLNMGFIDDVDFILSCLLQDHQTLLFSATMPREIAVLADKYLTDPVRVELNRDRRAPQSLEHHFLHSGHDRLKTLTGFLEGNGVEQAIIFCNTRDRGSELYGRLRRQFSSVDFLHGGLDQNRRTSIFNRFREKQIKYMVATDVAGRGLDFTHVSHVINYDFPFNPLTYTHRTGRTGRMGRKGVAVTLVTDRDLRGLKTLLHANRIEPLWSGREPDLSGLGPSRSRRHSQDTRKSGGGKGSSGGRRREHHGPPHHGEHHGQDGGTRRSGKSRGGRGGGGKRRGGGGRAA